MNKKIDSRQFWLYNRWLEKDEIYIIQPMFFQKADNTLVQKRVY